MNVSGILHCTGLWRDLKLFYSLLFFTRAFLCLWRWVLLAEGGGDSIGFLPHPLGVHLYTKGSLLQTPARLGQQDVLRGNPNARALIPPWLPSSNDGWELVDKKTQLPQPCSGAMVNSANSRVQGNLWKFPSRTVLQRPPGFDNLPFLGCCTFLSHFLYYCFLESPHKEIVSSHSSLRSHF